MENKGKTTCKILKDIRRQIAEANDIRLVIEECTYQGECAGTCPRCEAEVAYLEREIAKRQALGKAVKIIGLAAGSFAAVACTHTPRVFHPLEGSVPRQEIDSTDATDPENNVPEEVFELEGDVAYIPDEEPGESQEENKQ